MRKEMGIWGGLREEGGNCGLCEYVLSKGFGVILECKENILMLRGRWIEKVSVRKGWGRGGR